MITKAFDKIQHLTMIFVKNLFNQLGLERNLCNLIKGSLKKTTANIILNYMNFLLLISGTRQACPHSRFYSTSN